jgi:hypothetical protein
LVLIHLDPLDDPNDPVDIVAARRTFPNSEIGFDGMQIDF